MRKEWFEKYKIQYDKNAIQLGTLSTHAHYLGSQSGKIHSRCCSLITSHREKLRVFFCSR